MENIIVPTDFSPVSDNAVEYAVGLAKLFKAKLVLLNVCAPKKINYEIRSGSDYNAITQAKIVMPENSFAYGKLKQLKKDLYEKHGELLIECIAEAGSPYDVITRVASEQNADLIVMGITGYAGRIKEHFIGSISVKVARNQDIPTFIIPENVKYTNIQKISFACDLKKTEETNLAYTAKSFSKAFDAELEVVNIEYPEEEISVEKSITNFFIEDVLENIKHTTIHISGENVAHELEDYFRTFKTDVIMVSPRKHNAFYYLFNPSITKELAFHSGLPILAIH
jgi:nucleotide-binding universal stress UspA family protein